MATPVRTYALSGTVFFDYNGNAARDEDEPPIDGVRIQVAGVTSTSESDGSYSVAGVPTGSQQVYVESPSQEVATAFRYISSSLMDFQSIDDPIIVTVEHDTQVNIGLMRWLPEPITCG